MEAALRTAADTLEGKSLDKIEYEQVRGREGVKKATINISRKRDKDCSCIWSKKCKRNNGRDKKRNIRF